MYFSTLPIVAVLPLAFAQYGAAADSTTTSSSSPSTATTSSGKTIHAVDVGNGGLTFSPNSISAAVGDIVEFHFYPQKHSVAQSTFADPCKPISNGTSFFSGGIPTTTGPNPNTFQLTINSTAPIWFYCAVPGHCEQGMAGVINQASTGSKTLDAYISAAKNVSSTVAPAVVQGGVIGAALSGSSSSSSTSGSSSSSTASGTTSGSSSTSTSKSAGVETRGSVGWALMGVTGLLAVGFGGLMI